MNAEKVKESHSPLPWSVTLGRLKEGYPVFGFAIKCSGKEAFVASANIYQHAATTNDYTPEELEANAQFLCHAANCHEELVDALKIQHECGQPEKASLYDEEGVEGWRWIHPDGREWTEIGSWDEPPPMHPIAQAILAKAEKGEG